MPIGMSKPLGPVSCSSSTRAFESNSGEQSPCFVTAAIAAQCEDPVEARHYPGPSAGAATRCQCNSVYYSLQRACALCQNPQNELPGWSEYTANCSKAYRGLPVKVPSGVAIPAWAFLDVEINDTFDVDMARSLAFSYIEPRAPSDPEDSTPTLSSTEPFTPSGTTHDSSSTSAEFDTDDSTDSDAEQHGPADRTARLWAVSLAPPLL
ncbi:hypothetical protein NMY22_g892 [Coprinellus aureogranulatus]|nr:hypothetical protein NMY22_g892 [Coprinellus aureogranulatus]